MSSTCCKGTVPFYDWGNNNRWDKVALLQLDSGQVWLLNFWFLRNSITSVFSILGCFLELPRERNFLPFYFSSSHSHSFFCSLSFCISFLIPLSFPFWDAELENRGPAAILAPCVNGLPWERNHHREKLVWDAVSRSRQFSVSGFSLNYNQKPLSFITTRAT